MESGGSSSVAVFLQLHSESRSTGGRKGTRKGKAEAGGTPAELRPARDAKRDSANYK